MTILITIHNSQVKEVEPNIPYIVESIGIRIVVKFYTRRSRKDGMVTLFGRPCKKKGAVDFSKVYVASMESSK